MVGNFVDAIQSYLMGKDSYIFGDYIYNIPRWGLLDKLKDIYTSSEPEEKQREMALHALDSLVKEMQSRYYIVVSEYMKLKKK